MGKRRLVAIDKGWAWVVLIACFWTMLTVMSIQRTSAVLFKAMMTTYGITREEAAWPFYLRKTVGVFTGTVIGITSGILSVRSLMIGAVAFCFFGLVSMFFTDDIFAVTMLFGVLYGTGTGAIVIVNMVTVTSFFDKYRTVASGAMLAGSSVGAFILCPLTEYLINTYGLRGSFLLLSGISLQGFIACFLYCDPPPPKQEQTLNRQPSIAEKIHPASVTTGTITETGSSSDMQSVHTETKTSEQGKEMSSLGFLNIFMRFLKSFIYIFSFPMFHVIWLTYVTFEFSFYTFLTVIVDHGSDCGIDRYRSVFLLSACSISELCGRLGGGWVIDLKLMRRKMATTLCFLLMGIIFICMPMLRNYAVLMFLTAFTGFLGSCILINTSPLYSEYVGLGYLPLCIGIGSCFTGFLGLATPSIIGHIRDTTGSYNLLFYSFGGLLLLSTALWLMEPLFVKLQPRNCSSREINNSSAGINNK